MHWTLWPFTQIWQSRIWPLSHTFATEDKMRWDVRKSQLMTFIFMTVSGLHCNILYYLIFNSDTTASFHLYANKEILPISSWLKPVWIIHILLIKLHKCIFFHSIGNGQGRESIYQAFVIMRAVTKYKDLRST